MARRYFAVVKKDDYETTASTGGVVVMTYYWPEKASDRAYDVYNIENMYGPNHELIPCTEECKIGWIYTDKTHQLVDSNKG